MTTETIADGSVVTIHYTLKNAQGEEMDSSVGGEPMDYLHGAENIVPGLERELSGRKVGDKVAAVVMPADGYGERTGPEPQPVPRSSFPDDADLHEGMQVMARGPEDETFALWVVGVDEESVVLDHNHPMAGLTLHFEVEITGIRAATEEELAHGHPHGPHGHHH
jgi:FKBP-type peptidyl-prolyl cis-trans isomerase SlyD